MKKTIRILLVACFALCSNYLFALPSTTTPELTVSVAGEFYIRGAFMELCEPNTFGQYVAPPSLSLAGAYFCSISLSKLNLPTGVFSVGNLQARDLNHDGLLDVLLYLSVSTNIGNPPNDTKVLADVCNVSGIALPVVDSTCTLPSLGGMCPHAFTSSIDGGIINLEVNKFFPNNSPCSDKNVAQTSIVGQVYGIPVSLKLRNALQCVQDLTVGSSAEDDMPNLSKNIIASVFTGGMANWDKLQAKKADGSFASLSVAYADRIANGLYPSVALPSDARFVSVKPRLVLHQVLSFGLNS